VLDATQSAGLGLVLATQISPPNLRILHLRLRSHKERLGRAQEAVKRLYKWSGTSSPRERWWRAFYRESGKLAVGVSETQTCPGRGPNMSDHPLWNPAWGWICPVRDCHWGIRLGRTCLARVSRIRLGGRTSSWIGPIGLTGVQYRSDRCDRF
jgi:hypothetical protein